MLGCEVYSAFLLEDSRVVEGNEERARGTTDRVNLLASPEKQAKPEGQLQRLVWESGAREHPDFQEHYSVECPIGEQVRDEITFRYAHVNGRPRKLFEWIPFPRTGRVLRRNVYSTAFKFGKAKERLQIDPGDCVSLVYCDDDKMETESVRHSLDILEGVGTVVDIRDEDRVLEALTPSSR